MIIVAENELGFEKPVQRDYTVADVLISVIVPVYNVKPFLSDSVESIINQTYKNLEILIIDDGSTDGSDKVCDYYAKTDTRITVIHQCNKGLSAARNTGLDIARGQMIAFLDSDDAFYPNMMEFMLEKMICSHADIAVCEFDRVKTTGRLTIDIINGNQLIDKLKWRTFRKDEALQAVYTSEICPAVWNKLYRSEVWERLRFPEGKVYEGSYCSFAIFDRVEKVLITNVRLMVHRNRPKSICNTLTVNNIIDSETAGLQRIKYVKEHTPKVFSSQQLKKIKALRIKGLMGGYAQYYHKNPYDNTGINVLRRMLIQANCEDYLICCNIFVRCGYYIILKFPRIGVILYNLYKRFAALAAQKSMGSEQS